MTESIYKESFERNVPDLIFVIHKLREGNAFVYVAQNDVVSKPLMAENQFVVDQAEKMLIQAENSIQNTALVIAKLLSLRIDRSLNHIHTIVIFFFFKKKHCFANFCFYCAFRLVACQRLY